MLINAMEVDVAIEITTNLKRKNISDRTVTCPAFIN